MRSPRLLGYPICCALVWEAATSETKQFCFSHLLLLNRGWWKTSPTLLMHLSYSRPDASYVNLDPLCFIIHCLRCRNISTYCKIPKFVRDKQRGENYRNFLFGAVLNRISSNIKDYPTCMRSRWESHFYDASAEILLCFGSSLILFISS